MCILEYLPQGARIVHPCGYEEVAAGIRTSPASIATASKRYNLRLAGGIINGVKQILVSDQIQQVAARSRPMSLAPCHHRVRNSGADLSLRRSAATSQH